MSRERVNKLVLLGLDRGLTGCGILVRSSSIPSILSQQRMLKYLPHARERMKERNISRAEVESCLTNHDISYTDRKGNPIYCANVGGRRIKVVVQLDNPSVVITVGD